MPEDSIYKMAFAPAKQFSFTDRGKIEKGCKANLLVIDPEVFTDNADFSGRSEFASGLWCSMIGGEFTVKEDALTSTAPASFYTPEQGQVFARDAMLNVLSVLKAEIGDLDRVKSCVKILVFVASADDFYDQPAVANGATKLLGEEIGMNVLPGNLSIEIEAIFELYE